MDLRETGLEVLGLDSNISGQGPVADPYDNRNEPLDDIKGKEFLG
jgi:hypothetical protein